MWKTKLKEVLYLLFGKKKYGKGRIFYSSIGHSLSDFNLPEVMNIQMRGFRWASEGKYVEEENIITPIYKLNAQ